MLDHADIIKIIEAQKEIFATKEDFFVFQEEMKKDFSHMINSLEY
jgi:hypothetical protein